MLYILQVISYKLEKLLSKHFKNLNRFEYVGGKHFILNLLIIVSY